MSTRMRVDDHMDMLRHDDVPDQADAESLLQYTQSVRYDSFQTVVVKERQTPSAGDRPEVRITRFVISAEMRGHDAERISSSPPCPKDMGHPALLRHGHRGAFASIVFAPSHR